MKFDSNQAWNQAVAMVGAHRAVLIPVAGVFFLLPGLASSWLMSDAYAALLAGMRDPQTLNQVLSQSGGRIYGFGLLSFLVQMVGYMTLLGLLTDRARPTVGEAIGKAVRGLPTLIAATLLFFVGYLLVALVLGMVAGVIIAIAKSAALAFVLGLALVAAVFYVMTKLSLTLPVIVIDGVTNPITALTRSWRLTSGNSLRIFLFYLLLGIGLIVIYLVIMMVVGLAVGFGGVAAGALPMSGGAVIAIGLIGSIIGMVVNVLLTGVLAAIHGQLAGPSTESFNDTFA